MPASMDIDYYQQFTPRIPSHPSGLESSSSPFEFSSALSAPSTIPTSGPRGRGGVPRTPPALAASLELPSNPKDAVFAALRAQRAPSPPPAPPTISTFSASAQNHIHIVQPYIHTGSQPHTHHAQAHSQPHNPFCTNPALHTQFIHHGYADEAAAALMGYGAGAGGPAGAAGQPPRPANAWILYRSDKMRDLKPPPAGQPRPPQADISKLIAAMWKNEAPEVRQHYEALSDMKKAEHLALYPGYRFQPMKKADKDKARAEKKAERERERAAAAANKSANPPATARKPRVKQKTDEQSSSSSSSQPTPIMGILGTPMVVPMTGTQFVALPPGTSFVPWPPHGAAPAGMVPVMARSHPNAYSPYAVSQSSTSSKSRKRTRTAPPQDSEGMAPKPESTTPSLESSFASPTNYWSPDTTDHPTEYLSLSITGDPQAMPWDSRDEASLMENFTSGNNGADESGATVSLEPVDENIFQFTHFDETMLESHAELPISLPEDYSFDSFGFGLFNDLGAGLDSFGLHMGDSSGTTGASAGGEGGGASSCISPTELGMQSPVDSQYSGTGPSVVNLAYQPASFSAALESLEATGRSPSSSNSTSSQQRHQQQPYLMSPTAFTTSSFGQPYSGVGSGSEGERERGDVDGFTPPLSAGTSRHSDWGQYPPSSSGSQHSTPVRW